MSKLLKQLQGKWTHPTYPDHHFKIVELNVPKNKLYYVGYRNNEPEFGWEIGLDEFLNTYTPKDE